MVEEEFYCDNATVGEDCCSSQCQYCRIHEDMFDDEDWLDDIFDDL